MPSFLTSFLRIFCQYIVIAFLEIFEYNKENDKLALALYEGVDSA